MSRLLRFIVTGFYSGTSKLAPGTVGTLVALAISFYLISYSIYGLTRESMIYLTLGSTVLGLFAINFLYTDGTYRSGEKDPQEIVIDEFAGYWLTTCFVPPTVESLVIAFFLFRTFDIWKPFPISQLEEWPGAAGIMADDLGAGVAAGACLYCLYYFYL